jgi:hypothetical protein
VTKYISNNPRFLSQVKVRSNGSRNLSVSYSRSAYHVPIDRFANDEKKESSLSFNAAAVPATRNSVNMASLSLCQSLISPRLSNLSLGGRLDTTNANSTVRNFSTVNETSRQKSTLSNETKDTNVDPSSDSSDSDDPTKTQQLKSAAQKGTDAAKQGASSIRDMIKKYGWTFIGTYMGVYFITLGSLFGALDSGLIDPLTLTSIEVPWHSSGVEDGAASDSTTDRDDFDSTVEFVASYMKKFSWLAPYSDLPLKNPHMANLAIAWVATKLTEPIRLPVTIGIVRKIAKDKE